MSENSNPPEEVEKTTEDEKAEARQAKQLAAHLRAERLRVANRRTFRGSDGIEKKG